MILNFFRKIFSKKEVYSPEDKYVVIISEETITVQHPERETQTINWNDIETIKLINTDEGPFLPDIWLALLGKNSGCLIPQGSKGFEDIYNIISEYENFNFENFINSMSSTDNEEFLLWTKNN